MDVWHDADDPDLLAAVGNGHVEALAELYARHEPWLAVRLHHRCNDREVVADVLQDTFVAVWRSADRFRGDGEVAAWMWGIAIRQLVGRLRHRRPAEPVGEAPAAMPPQPSAEEAVLQGVEFGDVGQAVSGLSPELRAVLQATVLDGLSAREAGRLLGVSEVTVRTRLHRARRRLRLVLAQGSPT
jgi:RNA polymerase sigma-70 factor (ECF subfamily)